MSAIFRRMIDGMNYVLGLSRGGRNFRVFDDDIFLVSYPRSGNTWLRFLVANLREPSGSTSFANLESRMHDVYARTRRTLAQIPRPRVLKSHEYFDPRYKQVIYIVRDPRDVVVSYYFFHLKRGLIEQGVTWGQYVREFIAGELDSYGSWCENVVTWLAARGNGQRFLLLRYEDMLERTENELAKIALFLGLPQSPERIRKAVELSSAERMRSLEQKEANLWAITKGTRKDIPFVRTAVSGGWRRFLQDELVAEIESAWGQVMEQLGYKLETKQGKAAASARSPVCLDLTSLHKHWNTRSALSVGVADAKQVIR
jgi:hypothetical protein